MRTYGKLALAAATALLAALGARALDLAQTAPFEIDVVLHRRPGMRIRGARFAWTAGERSLVAVAAHAAPASDRIGHMSLGPSRHLALREVAVSCEQVGARVFSASADAGELRAAVLVLDTGVRMQRGTERERVVRSARVHLATGRLTAE